MSADAPAQTWKGNPDLENQLVPVVDLQPHPSNPRHGDVRLVAESLDRFGQMKPIVVHRYSGLPGHGEAKAGTLTIVAGNHTFKAAVSLGWTHVAATEHTGTDEAADAFLLADNRASDTATYDDAKLLELLESEAERGNLDATGFSLDDVEDLAAALDRVKEAAGNDEAGYAEDPEDTAERWGDRNEGAGREVVLIIPQQSFEGFKAHVAFLKERWGIDQAGACVVRAMRREAEQEGLRAEGGMEAQ